jgi:hypothetical protein
MVVGGDDKPKLAFPPKRDLIKAEEFQRLIADFFDISKSLGQETTIYQLSKEAKAYWLEVYKDLDKDFGFISDDAVISSFERLNNETIFKIATVFHCLENLEAEYVSKATLVMAIELVKYFKHSLLYVLDQLKTEAIRNLAKKIVTKMQNYRTEGLSHKRLKDACGGYKSEKFDEALDWLIDLGIIEIKEFENSSNNETVSKIVYLMIENNI